MKQFLKVFVSFPVLALLMFGIINQSLCGGDEYYMRFTEIDVALVGLNSETEYDTIHYISPLKTVIDTVNYFELDSVNPGNSNSMTGIFMSFGVDYCDVGAGNIAYAAVEPGGGGFVHPLKSVKVFSIEPSGALIDISPYAIGLDSIFRYRWKQTADTELENASSFGLLSAYTDSFNVSWRINRPPGMYFYEEKITFLYRLESSTLAQIPDHYHLKLIVEFEDGLIVESECTGIK